MQSTARLLQQAWANHSSKTHSIGPVVQIPSIQWCPILRLDDANKQQRAVAEATRPTDSVGPCSHQHFNTTEV